MSCTIGVIGVRSVQSAAGYPFDIPPVGAGLAAFCTLAYHLPLTVAFSVAERATFVWGGCMLLRRGALQPCDHHGILRVRASSKFFPCAAVSLHTPALYRQATRA